MEFNEKVVYRQRKKSYYEDVSKQLETTNTTKPNVIDNEEPDVLNTIPVEKKRRQRKLSIYSANEAEDGNIMSLDKKRLSTFLMNAPVVIIGICGGSCSGKTHLTHHIKNYFKTRDTKINYLKEKNFYKDITMSYEETLNYDYDSPEAIDWEKFLNCVNDLSDGFSSDVPVYDIFNNKRLKEFKQLTPCQILVIEGRLLFWKKELRDKFHLKIFLDTDPDIMLSRKIIKDTAREIPLEQAINRYVNFIQPCYKKYVYPSKIHAHLILDNYSLFDFDYSKEEGKFKKDRIINLINTIIKHKFEKITSMKSLSKITSNEQVV